jgi:Kef-type K+ transport system membrane component KefB
MISPPLQRVLAYALMIGGAVGALLLIRSAGSTLVAPSATNGGAVASTAAKGNVLFDVLFALVAIIVAAPICGAICKRLHQPPVIGEVIAGILLGPSRLGRISPEAMHWILPATVAPYLSILAQIGVILFMFLVGLELDTSKLRDRTHATIACEHPRAVSARLRVGVVALSDALHLHILSPTLLAMLLIMAVVTILATAPALQWIAPASLRETDLETVPS